MTPDQPSETAALKPDGQVGCGDRLAFDLGRLGDQFTHDLDAGLDGARGAAGLLDGQGWRRCGPASSPSLASHAGI